jgi:hypothetical protein
VTHVSLALAFGSRSWFIPHRQVQAKNERRPGEGQDRRKAGWDEQQLTESAAPGAAEGEEVRPDDLDGLGNLDNPLQGNYGLADILPRLS